MLGIDPLQAANEGKIVAIVAKGSGGQALDLLNGCALARGASIIGRVTSDNPGKVVVPPASGVGEFWQSPQESSYPEFVESAARSRVGTSHEFL